LANFYKKHRQFRFDGYRREQKAEDSLVKKLLRKEKGVTVFWGSGTSFFGSQETKSTLRGQGAPAKRFLKAVVRHPHVARVVIVDEYRSSKVDIYSMSR
jgi:hypothetical protein